MALLLNGIVSQSIGKFSADNYFRTAFGLNGSGSTILLNGKCADDVSMDIIDLLWEELQIIESAMIAEKWDLIEWI